jgi:glyceraldehyde 3-phosphate dehydrogenase
MTIRIAINGLGRIGRCVVRAIAELDNDNIELVAVNGPAPIEQHVHLLKYDSVHGIFPTIKKTGDDTISFGKGDIKLFRERDPENLPWGELGIDIVMECTGIFKTTEAAGKHITAGAKKVLISSPASDDTKTVVYGVNNETVNADDKVLSIGSCTTNCLAPVVKVLNDSIGIENGFMTTIHAYTNDQNIMDASHKDMRRARAAALSMIPTSTGAAKALSLVIPEMKGKLDGTAIRVPTPNVSLIDLTFTASRNTSVEEINKLVEDASIGKMAGILGYSEEPLVSIDYLHNPNSSSFDATGTKVVQGKLCRVISWYDNEWGFSIRMLDIAQMISE